MQKHLELTLQMSPGAVKADENVCYAAFDILNFSICINLEARHYW